MIVHCSQMMLLYATILSQKQKACHVSVLLQVYSTTTPQDVGFIVKERVKGRFITDLVVVLESNHAQLAMYE